MVLHFGLWKNIRKATSVFSVTRVIDSEGYRANVGIILTNPDGHVFWGRRFGQRSWQFPQGGIKSQETPEDAMYRELKEETGLLQEHVSLLGCTRRWLRYQLPSRFIRRNCHPVCIGQKQIWFLLRLLGDESAFDLGACDRPEFDFWQWVDYWYPSCAVVHFKRTVYSEALKELAHLLPGGVKRHERGRQRRPHVGR